MNLITRRTPFDGAMLHALDEARKLTADRLGIVGYGVAHLLDGDGKTKQLVPFANLITTAGDQYYARMGIAGIAPAGPAAPPAANGMKLGTATTAAHKSNAGAAAIASAGYIAGSNNPFDVGYPLAGAVAGTDTGWAATYKTTWPAGDATNATINEVALVNDQAADAASAVANTYSRAVIATVPKAADEFLAVTWNHKFQGV